MKWFWPLFIILSALAAGLVNFILPDLVGRPLIMLCFLCLCPGMMLIRFFHLKELVTEFTLAVALSLVIDATILTIQLYSGHWSPSTALIILISICIIGTATHSILIARVQSTSI